MWSECQAGQRLLHVSIRMVQFVLVKQSNGSPYRGSSLAFIGSRTFATARYEISTDIACEQCDLFAIHDVGLPHHMCIISNPSCVVYSICFISGIFSNINCYTSKPQ